MDKSTFLINNKSLERLGIDIEEGIKHLECKKAIDINPAQVKALQILKQSLPVVPSS